MKSDSERRKDKHIKSLTKAKRYLELLKVGETFTSKQIHGEIAGHGIDVRGAIVDLMEEKRIERVGLINFKGGGASTLYRRIK
jgi:hypothetical protein